MFWPFILASLALSAAGVVSLRPALPLWGALLSLPLAWYLTGSPLAWWQAAGAALPVLHLAAALALWRRAVPLAWAALAPVAGLTAWLAFVVLTA